MKTEVIHLVPGGDTSAAVRAGCEAISSGKLVGFGTETVYGVAAALGTDGLRRLRELKGRPELPFSVHLGNAKDVSRYVEKIPVRAKRLIERAFPGPVTILLRTGGTLADGNLQDAGVHEVLCYDDTIGLRCPDGEVTSEILSGVSSPVVAASANLAGGASPRNAEDVISVLDGKIDLLIDTGPTLYGKDSTIVRFDGEESELIRKGVYDAGEIDRLCGLKILFVCSGNTCRSPMAEGIARTLISERYGCKPSRLGSFGVTVDSAGTFGFSGSGATHEAIFAAGRLGADISAHSSKKTTIELINSSDLILCMTSAHGDDVRRLCPPAEDKVFRLDEQRDIHDPVGGGGSVYTKAAQQIERAIKKRMDKIF